MEWRRVVGNSEEGILGRTPSEIRFKLFLEILIPLQYSPRGGGNSSSCPIHIFKFPIGSIQGYGIRTVQHQNIYIMEYF
jgi:hypothetical protein